jgi:hypothetical protein
VVGGASVVRAGGASGVCGVSVVVGVRGVSGVVVRGGVSVVVTYRSGGVSAVGFDGSERGTSSTQPCGGSTGL